MELEVISMSMIEFEIFQKPKVLPFAFHDSRQVYEKMKDYNKADREMFILLFLDTKNNLLKEQIHSVGSIDSSAIYVAQVFKSALLNSASSLICVHHHPSGDPVPSSSDDLITRQLVMAGELLCIRVLDHIILGEGVYYSYGDEGKIAGYALEFNNKIG